MIARDEPLHPRYHKQATNREKALGRHYQALILNTLHHRLSNARTEATNTHLRALTKRAYGFRTPQALLAIAMLAHDVPEGVIRTGRTNPKSNIFGDVQNYFLQVCSLRWKKSFLSWSKYGLKDRR
jgi:hypothetical protein